MYFMNFVRKTLSGVRLLQHLAMQVRAHAQPITLSPEFAVGAASLPVLITDEL
jgi:hypothetical protein